MLRSIQLNSRSSWLNQIRNPCRFNRNVLGKERFKKGLFARVTPSDPCKFFLPGLVLIITTMHPFGISSFPPPPSHTARFVSGRKRGDFRKTVALGLAIWILILTLARKLYLRNMTDQHPHWDECNFRTWSKRAPCWAKES